MLILKNKACLTHDLTFRPCNFTEYWDLKPEFYWEIFKAEDVEYLRKIRNVIEMKASANNKVKENQYALTKNCPNICPRGDCESSESEDGEYSDSSNYNQNNNQRYPSNQQQQAYYGPSNTQQQPPAYYGPSNPNQTTNPFQSQNPLNLQIQQTIPFNQPPNSFNQSIYPMQPVYPKQNDEKIVLDKKEYYNLINSMRRQGSY